MKIYALRRRASFDNATGRLIGSPATSHINLTQNMEGVLRSLKPLWCEASKDRWAGGEPVCKNGHRDEGRSAPGCSASR